VAFGQLVLYNLYAKKGYTEATVAAMINGGFTVIACKRFMSFTGVYEIIRLIILVQKVKTISS
jgi:hypothetical protein